MSNLTSLRKSRRDRKNPEMRRAIEARVNRISELEQQAIALADVTWVCSTFDRDGSLAVVPISSESTLSQTEYRVRKASPIGSDARRTDTRQHSSSPDICIIRPTLRRHYYFLNLCPRYGNVFHTLD